jgi:integrase
MTMSVYKREWKDRQNKNHFCWYFHKTINGVRYRDSIPTARTRAQAEEAERAILAQIHEGTYGKSKGSMNFVAFAEEVYLPWAEENKRSKSDKYYVGVFKRFFGARTFSELSPMLIEKFKSERKKEPTKAGKPRKPASINRELECLSSILSMAMRKPYSHISENPCREVGKLREENGRCRFLSSEEEERLLSVCTADRAHLKPIIIIALNTGMRRGEILSLKWSEIDLGRGIIHLTRTKSGRPREIPISSVVRQELLNLQSGRDGDFVFGNPVTGRALTHCKRAFSSACRVAGVEDLHFHDLRHTAATRMAETGAEPSTIKDILGHSDLRITDRYTHAVEIRKRAAVERIAYFAKSADVVQFGEWREIQR